MLKPTGYGKQVVVNLKSFVSFVVSEEEFAVDIMRVREVIRLPAMTLVPNAPEFVEGIIHFRGRIVPVIDLRKRLKIAGREYKPLDRFTRVLIITLEGRWIGFIVDSVRGIIRVPQDYLKPVPGVLKSQIGGEYFDGVIQMEERLIMLLNLHRILSSEERDKLQSLNMEELKKALVDVI
ncbi:MAG: chemotaxis protein CheW [Syntrophobacterales bacterium]|nr:chemotaxis protein CheW [Syntrophobacterales bacterium]